MKDSLSLFLTASGIFIIISLWIWFVTFIGSIAQVYLRLPEEDAFIVCSFLLGSAVTFVSIGLIRRYQLSLSLLGDLIYIFLSMVWGMGIIAVLTRWPILILVIILFCVLLCVQLVIHSNITYQRHLKEHGFWVGHEGRDNLYYEEVHGDIFRRITISGEMMGAGPVHHVIYVPSDREWRDKMPEWASDRKQEIMTRIKNFLGEERYEYEENKR